MREPVCLMLAALVLAACGTDEIQIMGGSLQLNQKLRADMGASASMSVGRFFASGDCAGTGNQDGCQFVSAVQGSLVNADNRQFTNRLRRAPYLWVEGDGFTKLSYEFVGRGVNVVLKDNPTEIVGRDVDVGSCHGFPVSNPDTRLPFEEFEDFDEEAGEEYTQMYDVTVARCSAAGGASGNPETLAPQTSNCVTHSISSLVGNARHPRPQNSPLCLINVAANQIDADMSYSLTPSTRPGVALSDLWSGISAIQFNLEPHLKIVPVGGVRTISRRMTRTGERQINTDGSITHWFAWYVPLDGEQWAENFSPNIVVSRARVRRGAWTPNNRDYLNLEALEVGNQNCQVRVPGSGDTEFDVPMCNPGMAGSYRVTPGYRFEVLNAGRVDDGDRLLWDARVRVPPAASIDSEQLFLELDLTALSPIGTSGAGLLANPGVRHLGMIRTGATTTPQPGFDLHNFGSVSAYVESISFEGRDASEFGTIQVRRVSAPGSGAVSAVTTAFTAPFIFLAGSRAEVNVMPAFRTMGQKQAQAVIVFRDVRNAAQTLRVALQATAVTPLINVLPTTVYFYAQPGANGAASAMRAALMTNDGPIAFQRNGVSVDGPNASEFRLLGSEYGTSASSSSQPLTVASGAAEIYRFGFYPAAQGIREATFRIDTNEGQLLIALRGVCDQGCQQPPPPAQVREPPIVVKTPVKITYPKVRIRKVPKAPRAPD